MLDTLNPDPKLSARWRDHVTWGDIVSFRFPVRLPAEDCAQPKKRPCLVLDRTERAGRTFLTLAYGTSADTPANRGYEVAIFNPGRALAAGLHKPTRFVGSRRLIVPATHNGFVISRDTCSAILGRLAEAELDRLNAVRARIQAEADIAAEHRRERRGGFLGRRRKPARPFEVERRRISRA